MFIRPTWSVQSRTQCVALCVSTAFLEGALAMSLSLNVHCRLPDEMADCSHPLPGITSETEGDWRGLQPARDIKLDLSLQGGRLNSNATLPKSLEHLRTWAPLVAWGHPLDGMQARLNPWASYPTPNPPPTTHTHTRRQRHF